MARSRKKFPGWKDNQKFFKNYANRKVRRMKGRIPHGSFYKRMTDMGWSICDWKDIYYSKNELFFMIQNHLDEEKEKLADPNRKWNNAQRDYIRRWIDTFWRMRYQAYMK